jgi:hypothetical protein
LQKLLRHIERALDKLLSLESEMQRAMGILVGRRVARGAPV